MAIKIENNAASSLSAGITASATSLTLATGGGARFPSLSAGDYFWATLISGIDSSYLEIVKVTGRSGDTITVVRGQEGTVAKTFQANDLFEMRITAQTMRDFADAANLTGVVSLAQGGTGQTTEAGVRTALNVPTRTGGDASGTWGISISGSAATLTTGRTIGMTGDVTWTSGAFNGSGNVTGVATLANSGVTAGTYPKVTVNAKGIVTGGSALVSSDLPTYTGTLASSQVTSALGFTPYNATNPAGYITASASITGSSRHVSFLDTRAVNDQPQGKVGYSLSADFKDNSAVGSPPVTANPSYSHILTIAGWDTAGGSGGFPSQLSFGDGIAIRQASNATTWGAWRTVLHSGNFSSYALPLSGGTLTGGMTVANSSPALVLRDTDNSGTGVGQLGFISLQDSGSVERGWMGYGAASNTDLTLFNSRGDVVLSASTGVARVGAASILTANNYNSYALPLSGGTLTGNLTIAPTDSRSNRFINVYRGSLGADSAGLIVGTGSTNNWFIGHPYSGGGVFNALVISEREMINDGNSTLVKTPLMYFTPGAGTASGNVGIGKMNPTSKLDVDGAVAATSMSIGGSVVLHAGNFNSYAPTLGGVGASGTWGINVTGNAGSATRLINTRTINGTGFDGQTNIDTTEWIHSDRDFPSGTLITTNINYAVSSGDPFVLEIRGNSYGSSVPFDIQVQGYIYYDSIISYGGYSNGTGISGLVALNVGGNLCFWFPSQGYWHGYNVRAYSAYATRALNRVTSITGGAKPSGTKEVALSSSIRQSLHSGNFNSYAPTLTGAGASGTWGINVTGTAGSISGFGNPTTSVVGNTIVYRDASGHISGNYIFGSYFNAGSGNSENPTIGQIWTQNTSDNYLRKSTPAHFISQLGLMYYAGQSSGNWQNFTDTAGELRVDQVGDINNGSHSNQPPNVYTYGGVLSWRTANHSFQLYASHTGDLTFKTQWNNDNYSGWRRILHESNYNSFAPTLTGGGASGTWGINISGSAAALNGYASSEGGGASVVLRTASNGYLYLYNWINTGSGGLFSSTNGAHWYPSDSTFGTWKITGNRNGYSGISCGTNGGNVNWMVDMGGNLTGWYNETYGWQMYWSSGTLSVFKNSSGGGTQATVLDSSNYSNYALPLSGGTVTGASYFRSDLGATSGSLSSPPLQAYATGGNAAFMSFHRGGSYAVNMGLDSDNVLRIGGWSASANRLQMDMSGNLTMAGNVTAYSDERLKKDWLPPRIDFVERLAQVRAGSYTRIDSDERQAGVSAQAMLEVLPETVLEDADGTLALAYGNAALVAAVELAKELVKLKQELAELKARLH